MCFIATSNLLTCQLVNYQYSTTNFANDTNYLAIKIRAIREIRSSYHKVQTSKFKGKSIPQQTVSCTPPLSRRGGWGGEVHPDRVYLR